MTLFFATLFLTASVVSAAPSSGSCLCATTSNVNVRDAAGIHSHVITSMNRGECYIFNGGVLTKDGHIWYELQDVHGHHRVWAASEYLHKSSHSSCSGGGSSSGSGSSSFSSDESDGLQTLLGFGKGLDTIPSIGFDQSARLKSHHPNPVDEYDGYANILTVPVFMSDYDLF